jgi:hypothetical protein
VARRHHWISVYVRYFLFIVGLAEEHFHFI